MPTTRTTTRRRTILLGLVVAAILATATALTTAGTDDDGEAPASLGAAGTTGERAAPTTTTTTAAAAPSSTSTTATTAGEEAAETVPNDDAEFPDVPDADDEGPGPWYPPSSDVDDFAPNPVVLDLVADLDPELGEGGDAALGGSFASDAGCAAQCIRRAWATMGGTGVEIRVQTNTAARIWVVLDSPAVKDSGYPLRKDWTVSFDDLEPDTTYNVTLAAEDVHGGVSHRYGQIKTLERTVTVTFSSIDVIGDGDHGASKGEIEFFFAVNGTWRPEAHQGVQKIKSGGGIHLGDAGEVIVLEDAPADLVLIVQGVEHDHSPHFCPNGTPPYDDVSGGGVGDCIDYATAFEVFDVDHLGPANPALPSAHDAYFQLVTEQHHLKFRVHGAIDVTYG